MKLPLHCNVTYQKKFLSGAESQELLDHLMNFKELTAPFEITTLSGEAYRHTYGKMMFIDKDLFEEKKFPEAVWGANRIWSKEMAMVKERVETLTGHTFATCVCIYYPDGNSGVEYHSDFASFGDTSIIPSVSLGEERKFYLREKRTLEEHKFFLENGSLIIMGENCQELYEHSLPVDAAYKRPRINLTFRKYGFH